MLNYAWIALAVLAADQITKRLALSLTEAVPLIPGVIGLRLARNTGVAFSLFSGMPWLTVGLSAAILAAGALLLRRCRLGTLSKTGAMLILGGAVSNLLSRVIEGHVIDMIEILLFRFAVFNVADTALTVGCGLMILSLLIRPAEWEKRNE